MNFFSPYLVVEVCLHDDVDAKEEFNHMLLKNIFCSPTAYSQVLKDFVDFVKS
jgi:hypothetical protein